MRTYSKRDEHRSNDPLYLMREQEEASKCADELQCAATSDYEVEQYPEYGCKNYKKDQKR